MTQASSNTDMHVVNKTYFDGVFQLVVSGCQAVVEVVRAVRIEVEMRVMIPEVWKNSPLNWLRQASENYRLKIPLVTAEVEDYCLHSTNSKMIGLNRKKGSGVSCSKAG